MIGHSIIAFSFSWLADIMDLTKPSFNIKSDIIRANIFTCLTLLPSYITMIIIHHPNGGYIYIPLVIIIPLFVWFPTNKTYVALLGAACLLYIAFVSSLLLSAIK